MFERNSVEYTIFDAQGADATGKAIFCRDFKHAVFTISTDGNADADGKVKFQGAISAVSNAAPDFSAAATVTNMWDFIEVIDLEDGAAIDGDTGIDAGGADIYRVVEMNINALEYLCASITTRTAGEITLKVRLFNNQ